MHIVTLTDLQRSGGATIAATRQMQALVDAGARVTQIAYRAEAGESNWEVEVAGNALSSLVRKVERRALPFYATQQREDERASATLARQLEKLRPDIVNAHNLHAASRMGWRWNLLETAVKFAPVVWTVHDMWSFTGRCACAYDCTLFKTGCDARCPTPHEYPSLAPELIAPAWESRRAFYESYLEVVAVTPSRWMAQKAAAGLWRGHRIEVIPNCLPLDVFRPQSQSEARQSFGIDARGPVFLASATSWSDRHKGGAVLSAALADPLLNQQHFTVLTLGEGQLQAPANVRVISLGMLTEQAQVARAYAAADFLVHPALADNLPNVIVESLACGTPVVALPIGGVPEMVGPQTGFLAHEATATALAQSLLQAAQLPASERARLRAQCREFAQQQFDPAQQSRKLLALFSELIAQRKKVAL